MERSWRTPASFLSLALAAATVAAGLLAAAVDSRAQEKFGEGGVERLVEKLKNDLGMLGWRGRRDPGIRDPKEAARDLEQRRMQQEKEKRIGDARDSGAVSTYDEHNRALFGNLREEMGLKRRVLWRGLASPGS